MFASAAIQSILPLDSFVLIVASMCRARKSTTFMLQSVHILSGSYDYRLVVLSVLIAIAASYAALDIAGRVTSARGVAPSIWLTCGALAMGLGIRSMHHIGMAAMRLPATCRYDLRLVLLSVALAILIALVATSVVFFLRSEVRTGAGRKLAAAVVTGIGIPREKQTRNFEAFSHADGSMTRKYGGTGLGLTICKRLVELIDGRVWLESEPGACSTFQFVIRMAAVAELPSAVAAAKPERLRNLSVLVFDDNLTNRRVLAGILARWGMRTTLVERGRAGLDAPQRAEEAGQPFQFVLLDGLMPEMDGFSLAERIRSDAALTRATIMMLTSAGQLGDA